MNLNYLESKTERPKVVGGRVTVADLLLIEAAAMSRETSISQFVAWATTAAARKELTIESSVEQ